MRPLGYVTLGALGLALGGLACETLKSSKPLVPIKEYEKLIAGRMDANYIGTANCLAACHAHDQLKRDFEASTMGVQLSDKSGLPLVDCESCHGPGSLAVEGLTPEKVAEDEAAGKRTACRFETLTDLKGLPAGARSLICLKCHTGNATFSLHNWAVGAHALADVSCPDCHDIHAGAELIVHRDEMGAMCDRCHIDVAAQTALPSRHPSDNREMVCTDCHDPHGTTGPGLLKQPTVAQTCTSCHGEKEGPFAFNHADLENDCMACHTPHGSVNNNLLAAAEPFLCLQCHSGHWLSSPVGASELETKAAFYTRCSDCHSTIHGTDTPSASGRGTFLR